MATFLLEIITLRRYETCDGTWVGGGDFFCISTQNLCYLAKVFVSNGKHLLFLRSRAKVCFAVL